MFLMRTKPNRALGWPRMTEPFGLFDRGIDRLFDEVLADAATAPTAGGIDVWEDKDHLYVEADLPGLERDDIDVTVEDGVLSIRAGKDESQKRKDRNYHVAERHSRRFERHLRLPEHIDSSKVDATLKDGVLTVKLDRREQAKRRKIEVQGQ
jgi:HSP20 family protein